MISAAIAKNFALLVRDRGALISMFVLPVVFTIFFGSMFKFGGSSDAPRPIAVWHSGDPRGIAVTAQLTASKVFAPSLAATAEAARAQVASEEVRAAVIVPPGDGTIEIAIDLGSPIQVRGPLEQGLRALVADAVAPRSRAVAIEARTPPGIAEALPLVSGFQLTVPGNAVMFGFFMALTVAMSFAHDRRSGTWRRLLAAPIPRWQALLAMLVPYSLVGIIQLTFLFGLGIGLFGLEVTGSPLALCALAVAVVICAVSLGLLMASFARTEKQLGAIGSVMLFVMGMLGGCMFPRLAMPEFMKQIGLAVPHSWAIDGFSELLIRKGTSFADVAPSIAAVLGFAVVFATLGAALFRFER